MCVSQGRPITIYPGLNCKLTDTIFLRDIDDVYNVAAGREAGEFVIRRHDGGRTLLFASSDREEIVKVSILEVFPELSHTTVFK